VNPKRFLIFVCACSMSMLLWPSDAAAQRRGSGGTRTAPARPSDHAVQRGGGNPPPSRGVYGGGNYYRPYYSYRPYFYRPFFYSPYFYNGFYASFYYGLGWYPYYSGFGYGYGYPYGYQYGYPYGYPYRYGYGAWSSARIEVKPRDAQVYVDGYFVGIVDQFDGVFQRLDVPAGGHEIAIYLPGYRTYRERTYFQPGESYHYKANLEPLAPGAPPEPKPQPSATPPQNQPYGGGMYPEGPYRQPPPPPDSGEPGRTQPMPERPGRAPRGESAGFGTLNLRVQPADATVQIDGERWDSPEGGSRLVVQLAAGPHRIDVRKDGFRPYSTTIQIRPGEPQSLNISLPQQ